MLLNHLKIRTRLYLGFASLIALGIAVDGVGTWGVNSISREAGRMDNLSGTARSLLQASQDAERIGRIMLKARSDYDSDMAPLLQKTQSDVRQRVQQARDQSTSSAYRELYDSVLQNLGKQTDAADRQLSAGHAMIEGRTKLITGGDALTAAATRLVAAAKDQPAEVILAAAEVERDALLVRVANWRFLATKDAKGPATFGTNVEHAMASLDALQKLGVAGLEPSISAVRESLGAYRDAFNVTAPDLLSMAEIYDTIQRPVIHAMQADLEKAVTSLQNEISGAAATSASVQSLVGTVLLLVAGLVLVLGFGLAFLIGQGIARPITAMTAAMKRLASGTYDAAIPAEDSRDEIGEMARTVKVFKDSLIETERLTATQEADRTARLQRQDAMDRHTQAFGTSVAGVMDSLGSAAEQMRRAADVMTESARAVHDQASITAQGAGQSSADLTAVAAAVEQFTSSVAEISRQVTVASEVATQAVHKADTSQATIRGLADSTARIGNVVRLIDSIAGQTNLLALNATIEAARAGDAGKGFAVVAGEVKALAAQTAKATADIGAQIESVRTATDDAVAAMNDIGAIIARMGEVSTAISAAVEEQSVTTKEIAASVQGVAGSTAQAAAAMENVVQVADRAGDASRRILDEATQVGSATGKLRNEVEHFLQAVKTG